MSEPSFQPNTYIARFELRERVYAFLVTSAALFVIFCFLWPLSVTGFRSVSKIHVLPGTEAISQEQLETMLGEAVLMETEGNGLPSIIEQVAANGRLNSGQLEFLEQLSISDGIKFGVINRNQEYELSVVYDGQGSEDEQSMVNELCSRVANRLAIQSQQVASNRVPLKNLEQADWIAQQIANDLSVVKDGLKQYSTGTQLPKASGATPFHQASSTKVVSSAPEDLKQTIDSIDVQSLRTVLKDLKDQVSGQERTSAAIGDGAGLVITSLTPAKTIPLRGVPGLGALLVMVALSGIVGTVVAGHFQPFAERGFADVEAIGKSLGIPVIAKLKSQAQASSKNSKVMHWANRTVKVSGLVLFGMFVVVSGFILTNLEVRDAFFENPFFGLAKMIRVFVGY